MWLETNVRCPACRSTGPFRMFGRHTMIDLKRPEPLENQVMVTCPFGTHRFAMRRIREFFGEPEWKQMLEIVEKYKTEFFKT